MDPQAHTQDLVTSRENDAKARGDGAWCMSRAQDVHGASPYFTCANPRLSVTHPRLTVTHPRTASRIARIQTRILSPHQDPLHQGTQRASKKHPCHSPCVLTAPSLNLRTQGPHLQVTEEQGAPVGVGQLHDGVPVNAAVALPPSCKEAMACNLYLRDCNLGSTGPSSSFPLSGPQFLTSQWGDNPVLPSFQGSRDHQIRKQAEGARRECSIKPRMSSSVE